MSLGELKKLISNKFDKEIIYGIVAKKTDLKNFEIKKIKIGEGSKKGDSYLSRICRFSVEISGENSMGESKSVTIPIIAKSLHSNVVCKKTFRSADFFKNEVTFYQKVWPALDKFQKSRNVPILFDKIPRCLDSYSDGLNDYIALEDLTPLHFTILQRSNGLDEAHILLFFNLFAEYHGLSLAYKDQAPEEFEKTASLLQETYCSEELRTWNQKFQETLCAITKDAVTKELPVHYLNKFNKLIAGDLYGRISKLCQKRGSLSVVTHGDVWIPNFLIHYDQNDRPNDIKMIDFQLSRYTSLSTDLLFFLFASVNMQLLERKWDKLLMFYYKKLGETIESYGSKKDLVSFEDLKADIKANILFGIGMAMEALIMSLLDDSEIVDIESIEGEEAVPLESVLVVHPFKDKNKRKRVADIIKFVVDKDFL